jgi:hypothetical protein
MRTPLQLYRNLWCGLLMLILPACIIIPVPRYDTAETRRNISEQEISVFKPGITTRRDVILALGEPDAVSIGERRLVYCRQQVVAWGMIAGFEGPAAAGDAGDICDTDFFVAEFDVGGVLINFAEAKHFPEMIPRLSNYGGNKVILQKTANWYPDMNGFHPLWHKSVYGNRGQLLLTDIELIFIAYEPFANDGPDCRIAFSAIAAVRLDAFGPACRLVIRGKTGALNSFDILKPKGWMITEKEASQQVHEFLQKKISP